MTPNISIIIPWALVAIMLAFWLAAWLGVRRRADDHDTYHAALQFIADGHANRFGDLEFARAIIYGQPDVTARYYKTWPAYLAAWHDTRQEED